MSLLHQLLVFFFDATIIPKNFAAEFTTMSESLFTCISIISSGIVSGKDVTYVDKSLSR